MPHRPHSGALKTNDQSEFCLLVAVCRLASCFVSMVQNVIENQASFLSVQDGASVELKVVSEFTAVTLT